MPTWMYEYRASNSGDRTGTAASSSLSFGLAKPVAKRYKPLLHPPFPYNTQPTHSHHRLSSGDKELCLHRLLFLQYLDRLRTFRQIIKDSTLGHTFICSSSLAARGSLLLLRSQTSSAHRHSSNSEAASCWRPPRSTHGTKTLTRSRSCSPATLSFSCPTSWRSYRSAPRPPRPPATSGSCLHSSPYQVRSPLKSNFWLSQSLLPRSLLMSDVYIDKQATPFRESDWVEEEDILAALGISSKNDLQQMYSLLHASSSSGASPRPPSASSSSYSSGPVVVAGTQ